VDAAVPPSLRVDNRTSRLPDHVVVVISDVENFFGHGEVNWYTGKHVHKYTGKKVDT
jgi:hypothetical protein